MNFLNKAKETANKINGDNHSLPGKPPIANKPKLPGVGVKPGVAPKPGIGAPPIGKRPPVKVGAKPVENKTETTTNTEIKSPSPLAVNNPFIKKDITKPTEIKEVNTNIVEEDSKKEEVKVPETTSEVKKDAAQVVEKKAAAVEETKDKVEEETTKAEETVKEEPKEEPKEESNEDTETVEPKTEDKKKETKRKRRGKKSSDETSDIAEDDQEEVVIPTSNVSFAEAVASLRSNFVDNEWENFREDTTKAINDITITSNMTPSVIKSTLSDLTLFRDSIWVEYNDTKTLYENLMGKDPEGIIERKKRISAVGSNTEERKLNATLSVMNNKNKDGKIINLYEVLDELRERYNYLKSLMDNIAYKNSVLVTMLGSLKLEK